VSVLTIIRTDVAAPCEQIVGGDVSEGHAEALIEWGRAVPGPDYQLPPAICLLQDLDLHGLRYPEGSLLTVGYEISEAECLVLLRGIIGTPGGGVAARPGGPIG
jgi:hypothetical protein